MYRKNELLLKRRCWIMLWQKQKYTFVDEFFLCGIVVAAAVVIFTFVWIALASSVNVAKKSVHIKNIVYVNWRWIRFIVTNESIFFVAHFFPLLWLLLPFIFLAGNIKATKKQIFEMPTSSIWFKSFCALLFVIINNEKIDIYFFFSVSLILDIVFFLYCVFF